MEWSWRNARRVGIFEEVWVATDAAEIADRVRGFGGEVVLTAPDHPSGTDRVAEVAARPSARRFETVVNYQADEPFLDPAAVARTALAVEEGRAPVATLAAPLGGREEWRAPEIVKVVRAADGRALCFSRAAIPRPREGEPEFTVEASSPYLRHVGLYAFTREALARWSALPPTRLERLERLEQLRALEAGMTIHVEVGPPTPPGVDRPDDLARAAAILRSQSIDQRNGSHV